MSCETPSLSTVSSPVLCSPYTASIVVVLNVNSRDTNLTDRFNDIANMSYFSDQFSPITFHIEVLDQQTAPSLRPQPD